jgi:type I restriction enzyme, S subunit
MVEERLARSRYPVVTIGSLEKRLQYGCSKRADVDAVGLPILRMSNMQPDGWDLRDLKYVELTDKERDLWLLEEGDILFNRTNSKELVGKCEVFREPGEWVFASYLMRLTVDTGQASPDFVSAYLSSPGGRAQIERESRQIIGMTNINAEEIRTLRIPLPKPDIQAALLAQLDAARKVRDKGLAVASSILQELDAFILNRLRLKLPKRHRAEHSFAVRASDVFGNRCDPQFFLPEYQEMLRAVRARPHQVLDSLVILSDETCDPAKLPDSAFKYIEIGAVAIRADQYDIVEIPTAEAPSRARMVVRKNDIIMSMTRPDRGAIARVQNADDGSIASTGFAVLRGREGSDRDFLFEVLQCSAVNLQLQQRSSGGAYPAITAEELRRIFVPWPHDASERAAIAAEVNSRRLEAKRIRAEAREGWAAARQAFEEALLVPAA